MTAPGGAHYLPPVVTQLLGDASDLLAKFAEAKAAQEAYAKSATDMGEKIKASTRGAGKDIDEFTDLVVRKMHAGESAAQVLKRRLREVGDEVAVLRKRIGVEGANQGLYHEFKRASDELERMRKLARQIAPELLAASQGFMAKIGLSFAGAFANAGSLIVPAIIAAVIVSLPVIAGLIGSAVAVGIGLGFTGLGVVLAAMLIPQVKRAFQTIGSSFQGALRYAVSGGFKTGLLDALSLFNRMIPTFGRKLRVIFDALAPALVPLTEALGTGLGFFLDDIGKMIPQIMPALLVFIETIPDVMSAVSEFLIEITKNGPALSRFITDAANAIVQFLYGAGKVISWLEGVYLWLVKANEVFPFIGWTHAVEGLGIGIEAVKNFFVDLWGTIVEAAKAVGSWFAGIGKAIWGFLTDAGAAVGDWFNATVGWFQKLPGRVIGFLASMPGRVTAVVKDLAHRAVYWVGWLIGKWVLFVTEAPGKIIGLVAAAWTWIKTKFVEGVTNTIAAIKAFPGQVAAFFSQLWTDVTAWVARTWTSVTAWFARTKASMIEHIASGINAVIAWFKGLPAKAVAEGKSFKDKIIAFFSGAKDWLMEAGKNIVRGVISGISSSWSWAVDKVKDFAHDLKEGFKDALGISSPSKAFEELGGYSAMGYERGWVKGMRKIKSAFSGPATADIIFSGDQGAPRRPGTPPPGGGSGGGAMMVHTVVKIGDRAVVDAITPASQRRGARNGITGTGVPTARIM